MKKIFIDEYLSIQLRKHINELVDLNLDLDSILSLLSNDLYGYSDYMILEIKRYIMYIMWLHDNHKDRSLAFEKYKKKTNQIKNVNSEQRKIDSSTNLSKELLLEQLRKERKRIDEVSNFNHHSKLELKDEDKIDEILETLSDAEIQETLSEILTVNEELETKMNKTSFEDEAIISTSQTMIEESLTNKDSNEITFEDILLENENSINSHNSQTLFDFDLFELEDNGTQTLDDSFFLEEGIVELEDIVDSRNSSEILESEMTNETKKALDFVRMLEEKYDDQTILSLNEEEYDLKTQDFTLAELTDTLKIGVKIRYKDEIYLVNNIETKFDLFNHEQTILTLNNPETNNEIKINAKKVK